MRRASLAATRAALANAIPFSGYCFRCTAARYANVRDALSGQGALYASGRFHLKEEFRIVYLGCDLHTAVEEFTQTAKHSGFEVARLLPATNIGVAVRLSTQQS
jgi:RES domain-containing protein